jgi:hypothetical protein
MQVFVWTRRVHYALGLYLLLFTWLFSVSGLLLNHSWPFADFWPKRVENTAERSIVAPRGSGGDLATAKALMTQLGLRGEIEEVKRDPKGAFVFSLTRPGTSAQVEADLGAGRARVKTTRVNGWGVFRTLHTFSGVHYEQPERRRDSLIAVVWASAMAASGVGLIAMVLTSLYLWWRLKDKRAMGAIALGVGLTVTGAFLIGLRLLA